jgi:hypothetical protein
MFIRPGSFITRSVSGVVQVVAYWDKDARHKLTSHELFKKQCPVTDVKFNPMVRTDCRITRLVFIFA